MEGFVVGIFHWHIVAVLHLVRVSNLKLKQLN